MDHHYVPDGAHRHHELEKVQREILQQHKYIESQLNSLKDNIRTMCTNGNGRCGTDYVINTVVDGHPMKENCHANRPSRYYDNTYSRNNRGVNRYPKQF